MLKSHRKKPWRAEGHKNAGWYSRITSSKLRKNAFIKGPKLQEAPMKKECLGKLRTGKAFRRWRTPSNLGVPEAVEKLERDSSSGTVVTARAATHTN